MALTVVIKVDTKGDRKAFERVSRRLKNTRALMKNIGVLAMTRSVERLQRVLKQEDDGVRTGSLTNSIRVGASGRGAGSTVWRLSNALIEAGTNLIYARQVHFGGTIRPTAGRKALAIPLTRQLKLSGESPRDIDPGRKLLTFIPTKGKGIGLLVDQGKELTGRQRKRRGQTRFGTGPLFLLVAQVTQKPRPFLFFDEVDRRVVRDELIPQHLGLKG